MKDVLRDAAARRARAILLAAFALCSVARATAATWIVTGIAEPATLASAACDTGAHTCPTLRDAVNSAATGDTIVFDASADGATINLTLFSNLPGCVTSNATTCSDGGTLGREFGPSAFFIDGRSITIDATALAHGVTISRAAASADFRLFDIAPGSGLALKGMILSGGMARGYSGKSGGGALGAGGAIFNQGTLTIAGCSLVGNTAAGGDTDLRLADTVSAGAGTGAISTTGGRGGFPNGGSFGSNVISGPPTPGSPGGFGGGGGAGGFSLNDGAANGGRGGFGGGGGSARTFPQGAFAQGGQGGFGGGGGANAWVTAAGGFGGGTSNSFGGAGAGLGGAIFNDAGTATVLNTTLVANRAIGGAGSFSSGGSGFGGAIFNYNGTLSVDFSTLTDNTVQRGTSGLASVGGTAIYSLGDSLAACSAGGNTCTSSGATLSMDMSVAARSLGSLNDVTLDAINGGTSTASGAGNFIASTQALNGTNTGALVTVNPPGVTDPMLATTLDANGGVGLTLMPQAGSPLIDSSGGSCNGKTADERGFARPQGDRCDIGAVEVRGPRITVDVTTPNGTVSLASPASLGGFGIQSCSPGNMDYCTTRVSSEAGAPNIVLDADADPGYRVASLGSDCGATLDTQNAQIDIAALAADCTVHVAFAANTVGGSVQGLAGSGLVLHLDPGDGGDGEDLPVAPATSTFTFMAAVATGNTFSVTVSAQPASPSQTCVVTNGSGTMPAANVSDIVVDCTTNRYTVGGTASGVNLAGLVLRNNGGDDLAINAAGAFAFASLVANGAPYIITVLSSPGGQSCVVSNGAGVMPNSNVTNVAVTCTVNTYTLGGTASGSNLAGLVLQNNGGDNLAVNSAGTFTFATRVANGASYNVTVLSSPSGQTCQITNGAGTMPNNNVINVAVTCTVNTYTLGGTASGSNLAGLVLQNNGGDNLTVNSAGTFTFATRVANGASYNVTVLSSPSGQTCQITNGAGTMPNNNVTNVAVTCTVNTHVLGGSVQNLAGSGLKLALAADNVPGESVFPDTGATSFSFPSAVAAGAQWNISVGQQPFNPSQTCTVTPGSGTMPDTNVSNIVVDCTTDAYTIGGNASGIDASGLVLQLNGGSNLPVNASGAFTFAGSLDSGAAYAVTILSQPAGRSCTLDHAIGTVGAGNVTDVGVACIALPQLALSTSDDSEFARYGQVVDYSVTLDNNGDGDASNVAVTFTLSTGFDGALAQFTCSGAAGGATCTQDGGNPLLYHVALPARHSLTWLVSVPVRADASDTTVEFSVVADAATPVTDTDTLVIFRNGFEGDAAQSAPIVAGAQAHAILDGDALREMQVPDALPATTTTLLVAADGSREVRAQARTVASDVRVRLLERGVDASERASPWSTAQASTTLTLGSIDAGDAPSTGARRAIVLTGATQPVALQ